MVHTGAQVVDVETAVGEAGPKDISHLNDIGKTFVEPQQIQKFPRVSFKASHNYTYFEVDISDTKL